MDNTEDILKNYRGKYSQFWIERWGLIPELPTSFDNANSIYELVAWLQRAFKYLLDDFQQLEAEFEDFKNAIIDLLEYLIPELIRRYHNSEEFRTVFIGLLEDILAGEERTWVKDLLKELIEVDMREWIEDYLKELNYIGMKEFFDEITAQLAQTMTVVNVRNYAKGDGTDETLKLQQALDDAEGKILFWNKQTGLEYRTKPLYVRQNTTIIFEPNTLVKATNGYISHDCVLNIRNVNNVIIEGNNSTIQMIKTEYTTGEHRHCLNIWGAENVRVSGMSFTDSGGDGILITGEQYTQPFRKAKNVNIFNCFMDNNRRQGISIAGYVEEVIVDKCVITNTNGTLPQAGIDIEPNGTEWDNRNITVQNCLLKDNAGAGLLVYNNSYNIKLLNNVLENDGITIQRTRPEDAHPSVEIKGNKTPSIYMHSVNNTLIEGNETGSIYIQSTFGSLSFNRVINNKVINSASKGIQIESNNNIVLYGNYIENSTEEAISLTQCESGVVENNTIIGCSSSSSMRVLNSPNTIVRGNKIRRKEKTTASSVGFDANSADSLVENNDFFDGAVTADIISDAPNIIIGTNTFLDGRKSAYRVTDFLPMARKGWMGRFVVMKKPSQPQELYTCVENTEGNTYTFKKIQFMD